MLHVEREEDFVLRIVSDELVREGAYDSGLCETYMHPLRVEENTITGLL